jgi:hypothetical protein
MTHVVANAPFDMNDLIVNGSLAEFFDFGEVVSSTDTQLVVTYSDATISEQLTLGGTFSNFDANGYPTTGLVTDVSYMVDGTVLFTVSEMSISVEDFTNFVLTDDLGGLFQSVLSGSDLLVGSGGDDV